MKKRNTRKRPPIKRSSEPSGRYTLPPVESSVKTRPEHPAIAAVEAGSAGVLYVVATPIGNLEDLSPRAKAILSRCGLVLAEDTRHFNTLAARFGIECKVRSYHDYNERAAAGPIVELLKTGIDAALVSDAGTPTINDPGYRLINACHEAGIQVRTVPGPCAFVAALSVSGFETHRFQFEGYMPPKGQKRAAYIQAMVDSGCTAIAYETPHRLLDTLEILSRLSPGHEICVARELTKVHEEVLRGPVEQVHSVLEKRGAVKGEIVLLLRSREYFQS